MVITSLFILLFSPSAVAQFEINKPYWYPNTNYQTLYVQVGDTSSAYSKEVVRYIGDNWKLCPVKFVNNRLLDTWLTEGNLFLSVEVYTMVSQNARANGTYSDPVYNDYFYLNFWTIDKKYKPGKELRDYMFTVARAELFYKKIGRARVSSEYKAFEVIDDPKSIYQQNIKPVDNLVYHFTDSSFSNLFLNGLPGNIRNMVQYVNSKLSNQQYRGLYDEPDASPALAKLKSDTLFVPNVYYGEPGTMLDEFKQDDKIYQANLKALADLWAAYPYKLKLIDRKELDARIKAGGKEIFYFNYIQSSADKLISVVNAQTGEIVYTRNSKRSYRLKENDFEKLGKAIDEK